MNKRFLICANCLEGAKEKLFKQTTAQEVVIYAIKIIREFKRRKWVNLWHPSQKDQVCKDCKYEMEHVALSEKVKK